MKNQVCITTLTISILQTSFDQFRLFKAGSVLLILGSILQFTGGTKGRGGKVEGKVEEEEEGADTSFTE